MWGPRSIAKLVNITPISLWFMILITIDTGVINQLITGGPHIVVISIINPIVKLELYIYKYVHHGGL